MNGGSYYLAIFLKILVGYNVHLNALK